MKEIYSSFVMVFISITLFAQNAEDTTDGRFHDDLLNHFVGKWNVTSIAHGHPFTAKIDVAWVLNHQNLRIHLLSNEVVPWFGVPMEFEEFVGYNHKSKRYVVHGMSIEGFDEDPSEGFFYGYRDGNEFKTEAKFGTDSLVVQRFTWQPASGTWNIASRWLIAGKEGEVFLDMNLVAIKPSSK
ncbi:MAG: hypothetical protein ABI675_11450 [Chitinophagaceae bacterium]